MDGLFAAQHLAERRAPTMIGVDEWSLSAAPFTHSSPDWFSKTFQLDNITDVYRVLQPRATDTWQPEHRTRTLELLGNSSYRGSFYGTPLDWRAVNATSAYATVVFIMFFIFSLPSIDRHRLGRQLLDDRVDVVIGR